jgi:hypothetical protein
VRQRLRESIKKEERTNRGKKEFKHGKLKFIRR